MFYSQIFSILMISLTTRIVWFEFHIKCSGNIMTIYHQNSQSRVRFYNPTDNDFIDIHKPHPKNIIKPTALKNIFNQLMDKQKI